VNMHGFKQQVHINGYSDDEDDYFPIFFNDLEKISDIEFYLSPDNIQWKKIKLKDLHIEDASYSSFYDGLKIYKVPVLKNTYFKLSYTETCSELKMLSSLYMKRSIRTDTIENIVNISKPLIFSWYFAQQDTTYKVTTDSSNLNGTISYIFRSVFPKSKPPAGKMKCSELIYCLVHLPDKTPQQELNTWFLLLIKPVTGINDETKNELKKITNGISDTVEMVKSIFDFVKTSVSYIDIEADYGAWQPRKADNILTAKKGDCKDMANLIYQFLQWTKIESYLGIMPTIAHADDFVFPSLSCANHAICCARIDSKWYFLDATDKKHEFNTPRNIRREEQFFVFQIKNHFN